MDDLGAGAAPRPALRRLLPYVRPHHRVLLVVAGLSLVGAGIALAQPLLVAAVISAVQQGASTARPVMVLVGLLVLGAVLDAVRTYLLQGTAEGVVLAPAGPWWPGCSGYRWLRSTGAGSAT